MSNSLANAVALEREKRRRHRTLPALLPHQTPPPGDWRRWLLLAGRGAGKTYAGSRWLLDAMRPGERIGIVAPTFGDVRDICLEGPSGLVTVARSLGYLITTYNRGLAEVEIHGTAIKGYSADEPDRLRGPQHHRLLFDELAAMRRGEEAYDMAMLGLRLGTDPRAMLITTPRPIKLLRALLADPDTVVTRATTYDNPHLADAFTATIVQRYEGTRLGRQELQGEILSDTPGALWTLSHLDATRVYDAPDLVRIVVGVDPKAGGDGSDGHTGIVVAGVAADGRGYVLADHTTNAGPLGWATAVLAAYRQYEATLIVAEINQGGAMVEHTLRTTPDGASVPIRLVRAAVGKVARAEPIAALYEQGRIVHVGTHPALEDEMTTYVPGRPSPDRLDALVWALTALYPATGVDWLMWED